MAGENELHIGDVCTAGVPVTDQDRALAFYVDKLGFEKRREYPMGGGGRWIEVAPAGETTTIALVAAPEGVQVGVETGVRFTTADADADHAALVADGVDADEVLRWPGVPAMFAFRDSDGNGLGVVEES
jgi:lactoylglutathione lyase